MRKKVLQFKSLFLGGGVLEGCALVPIVMFLLTRLCFILQICLVYNLVQFLPIIARVIQFPLKNYVFVM